MICYTRLKNGSAFKFKDVKTGRIETNAAKNAKLRKARVPPSYTDVSVCYNWSDDSWRAIGFDGTGQRQYFYSADHWADSQYKKLNELYLLGQNLPRIVREIGRLLDQREPTQRLLDALALKIMMLCNFRIGNVKNRDKYDTYGVTTLTRDHIKALRNGNMQISFVGKKQQLNKCDVIDKQVVWWLRWLVDQQRSRRASSSGLRHSAKTRVSDAESILSYNGYRVSAESVNRFLQDFDAGITAKVWRTWFANAAFIEELRSASLPEAKGARQQMVNEVVGKLAQQMHHSPTINRQSYLIKDLPAIYLHAPDVWERLSRATKNGTDFLMAFLEYHVSL